MHGASCPRGSARNRPRYEVADLARSAAAELVHSHALTPEQQRVLSDITRCRTAALGGHLEVCRDCGLERPVYDSCCNRHCPKCQALAAQRWLDRRLDRLLDTHYFHVTFTLPAELRGFARCHPQLVYDLLFQAATSTLLELGRDPHWLGAQLGITAVLHTWSRKLHWHSCARYPASSTPCFHSRSFIWLLEPTPARSSFPVRRSRSRTAFTGSASRSVRRISQGAHGTTCCFGTAPIATNLRSVAEQTPRYAAAPFIVRISGSGFARFWPVMQ
jgi:hypothetical protein